MARHSAGAQSSDHKKGDCRHLQAATRAFLMVAIILGFLIIRNSR